MKIDNDCRWWHFWNWNSDAPGGLIMGFVLSVVLIALGTYFGWF